MKTSLSVLSLLVALSASHASADPFSYSTEYTGDGYISETISVNVQPAEVRTISGVELSTTFGDSLFEETQEEVSGGVTPLGALSGAGDSLGGDDELGDGEPSDLTEDAFTVTEDTQSQIRAISDQVSCAGFYIGMNDGSAVSDLSAFGISNDDGNLQFTLSEGSYAVLAIPVSDLIPSGCTTSDLSQLYIETNLDSKSDTSCTAAVSGWLCTDTDVYALGDPWQTTDDVEEGDIIGDALSPIGSSDPDMPPFSSLGDVAGGDDDYFFYIWKANGEGTSVKLSLGTLDATLAPEPATVTLSLWALTALAARRRRK